MLKGHGWIGGGGSPVNVLEPGCGEGSFLEAIRETWPDADRLGVELNPELVRIARLRGHDVVKKDFLQCDDLPHYHLIVGNPPYVAAREFIEKSLAQLDPDHGTLAFLLPLNFLGGKKRFKGFWKEHIDKLSAIYVLPLRIGFTADGRSDSREYGIFVFSHWDQEPARLHFLDNTHLANKWRGKNLEWLWVRPGDKK